MINKILIVDDMEINRIILSEMLSSDYDIVEAGDGKQAIEIIERQKDEILAILLDLVMPVMDGWDVLSYLKDKGINDIPVLIISGEQSAESETKSFSYGVTDFIRKPFNNTVVRRRVKNVAELYSYRRALENKVATQTEELLSKNRILELQAKRLQESNEYIIDILGTVVESRNLESGAHIQRVKGYTEILAEDIKNRFPEYKLNDENIKIIIAASALHDVGKIAISDGILLKPGKLTPEEFEIMKTHTTKGSELLEQIKGAWGEEYGRYSYEICRHHHEKYDGKGYPDGLVGDDIPISAQIVSIADVYDALVSVRCYKDAFNKEEAFNMIMNGECGQFNPKLLESFKATKAQFEELADIAHHEDEEVQ